MKERNGKHKIKKINFVIPCDPVMLFSFIYDSQVWRMKESVNYLFIYYLFMI